MTEQIFTYTKPFLKWAGNKYRIIDRVRGTIISHASGRTKYIEPFGGSGSVAINLWDKFTKRIYGEYNQDLAHLMADVQGATSALKSEVQKLFIPANNDQDVYYKLREEFNALRGVAGRGTIRKSALFIYLNRHCFNGLCRYGPSGFNVPAGRYKTVTAPLEDIMLFSERMQLTLEVRSGDFEKLMDEADCDSLVYCDPPYFPLSATSSFTQYSGGKDFEKEAQLRLANAAQRAAERGAVVLISNHEVPVCMELYASMENARVAVDLSNRFAVPRFISAKGDGRGKPSPELIAVFRPR